MVDSLRKYSDVLSSRQLRILKLIADGMPNKQIAVEIGVSENHVKKLIAAIYVKLNAADRANAVYWGMRKGLIK